MKKVFFFMALAVAGLAMTACGSNKEGEKKDGNNADIAKEAAAYAQALHNFINAQDVDAATNAFNKLTALDEDLEKKMNDKNEKDYKEALNKECTKLGYNGFEDAIRQAQMQQQQLQQYQNGAYYQEPNYNMGDMDIEGMNMDDMDMSGMDMGDIDMSDIEDIAY